MRTTSVATSVPPGGTWASDPGDRDEAPASIGPRRPRARAGAFASWPAPPPGLLAAPADERAIEGLKFSECLPTDLAARVVQARLADALGVASVLGRATRSIVAD